MLKSKIITGDSLERNEVLEITKRKKIPTISFYGIGTGHGSSAIDKKRRILGMKKIIYLDGAQELIDMNDAEGFFFKMLLEEVSKFSIDDDRYISSAIVKIDISYLNRTDKNKITRGFKALEKKNIVRRIKRGGYYCINPTMVVIDRFNDEYDYFMSLKTTFEPIALS